MRTKTGKKGMRLPNGTGSVYKLNGNRRNPYIARITTGFEYNKDTGKMKQTYKIIGYFNDPQLAYKALLDYKENPFEISHTTTFTELYDIWKDTHFKIIAENSVKLYIYSYNLCKSIHNAKIVELKTTELQQVVNLGKSNATQRKIKSLLSVLYEFAMTQDLVSKNYGELTKITIKAGETTAKIFTEKELDDIKKDAENNILIAQYILILIYSGLRIDEFLNIKNIDIIDDFIDIHKSKTRAGIRKVPISNIVMKYVTNIKNSKNEYFVVNSKNKQMLYSNFYRDFFQLYMKEKGFKHKIHDTRHTTVTNLLANYVPESIVQQIVGHAGKNITQIVYTHHILETLRNAINTLT